MSISTSRPLVMLVAAAALTACGGGGAGAEGQAPASATSAPPSSPAPASASCGLPDFQARLLERVNALRASGASCGSAGSFGPAAALAWQSQLDQAAAAHSQDMAAQDYLSHDSLDGRTMADRVAATGYAWRLLGENIAGGYAGTDAVIDGWLASDGHCANLMNPGFTEFAVACVEGTGTRYGRYWTMKLAQPR